MRTGVNWGRAGALAVIAGALCVLVGSAPAQAQCVGDCNGDGSVTINELIIGVNIALGSASIEECESYDVNGDGEVTVNELITAVNNALTGCPDTPTPTPTIPGGETPTATPTGVPTGTVGATCTLREGTCSVTTTQTCTDDFGCPEGETCQLTGSSLSLLTEALPLNLVASGSVTIGCGDSDENGTAECTCGVADFNPIVIPAIGDICVNPHAGCGPGTVDCDGGTAYDVRMQADHNIATCDSNAACETACAAYCADFGQEYEVLSSSCEGFCQGGENAEQACLDDAECPGGTCPGQNPPAHSGACNCACQGVGLGEASGAGDLSCPVGVQIDVELPTDGDCEDENTIVLPPLCGAVTTTTAIGQIAKVNDSENDLPAQPSELTGQAISCDDLRAGNLTNLTVVGHLAFFDSTLGDVFSAQTFVCD